VSLNSSTPDAQPPLQMRRTTRKALINLVLFVLALIFIIYVGHGSSDNIPFAWTTVRYMTTAATLPEARGICPGLASNVKPALVVAQVGADGSPSWLESLSDLYHLCIYTADAPMDQESHYLQVPANRGHEAMAYLTFLIDNYADIPAAGAIFVHGSRWAWHNDHPVYDNAALLAALNVSAAVAPLGYHNLRCDWSTSTCSADTGPPQGSLETSMNAVLEPYNLRTVSDAALPRALVTLFGGDAVEDSSSSREGQQLLMGRNHVVRSQCCAQFVVAQANVWRHSREEYVALRQWLLDGTAPSDDRVSGRVLSYLWHILFIAPDAHDSQSSSPTGVDLERLNRLACPSADECYCRLYGRCDPQGCTSPGHCEGEYSLPPDLRLPQDWGAKHS